MADHRPFIDVESGELDLQQIVHETIPLVALITLFGAAGLLLVLLGTVVFSSSVLGVAFVIVAQFVLVVGTALVLLYVVARGVQIAET